MNEKKDFKYEAQEPVVVSKPSEDDVEIKDVIFLTPALVKYENESGTIGGSTNVSVDIANRKVYDSQGALWVHSDKMFEYLDSVNTLPEDFFEAGEDIYNEANKAVDEMEDIRKAALQGEE